MADEISTTTKQNKEELLSLEIESKRLEVEAKQLEIAERKANLQDVKERLDDRQLKRDDRQQMFLTKGQAIAQTNAAEKSVQANCNHKKGGQGRNGTVGQGDDFQYAVIKHKMSNGDIWVRCLRCAKTWKPPVKKNFKTTEAYIDAYTEYKSAVVFQTRNTDSGSAQFRWSDGGEYFREITDCVTLR